MGGGGGGEELYPTLHCHHQHDFYNKMGSNFNVSLTVRGKLSHKTVSINHNFWKI